MKSGRVFALVLLLALLGAAGVYLLKMRDAEIEKTKPWPTASMATQGGLTFLGVYDRMPDLVRVNDSADQPKNFWGKRWALFKYPRGVNQPVSDARFKGKGVPDILLWGFNEYSAKDPNDPVNYVAVPVPEQYSPEYQNGILALRKGAKQIGRWQINGMPNAVRQIAEKEPYVLEGEAAGCRFKLESPVEQLNDGAGNHVWAPMVQVDRPHAAPGDQFRMLVSTERTTWLKWPSTGSSPVQLPENGRVCAYLGSVHEMPSDRIGFSAKVQRYRTLDETITLKNLVVGRSKGLRDEYVLKSCDDPHIRTKNGFVADVVYRELNGYYEPDGYTVNIKSKTKIEDGILDDSPLYKQFGKPISIRCLNNSGEMWSANNAFWAFKLPPNKGEDTIKIPELKIVIRQTAVLEEKTLHFLAPVKEVKEFTVFGKPKKAK